MGVIGETEPDRPVTQGGLWADGALRRDLWTAGAVLLVVAFMVNVMLGPSDDVERAESGVEIGFGIIAALITTGVALWPRSMPDWAIGLRDGERPLPALRAPLVVLGWVLAAIATLAALAVGGDDAALGAGLIAVVAPLALARSLARFLDRADRTHAWAVARGFEWRPEAEVQPRTPLLRDGGLRYALNVVSGPFAGELNGELFHLACVSDGATDGGERTGRYTALTASVPDPGARLPLCVCAPRSQPPGSAAYERWRGELPRIRTASSAFDRLFELSIDSVGDQIRLRRLLEPAFLEQLSELSEGRLGWELEGASLTVWEHGHRSGASELERLIGLADMIAACARAELRERASSGSTGWG